MRWSEDKYKIDGYEWCGQNIVPCNKESPIVRSIRGSIGGGINTCMYDLGGPTIRMVGTFYGSSGTACTPLPIRACSLSHFLTSLWLSPRDLGEYFVCREGRKAETWVDQLLDRHLTHRCSELVLTFHEFCGQVPDEKACVCQPVLWSCSRQWLARDIDLMGNTS